MAAQTASRNTEQMEDNVLPRRVSIPILANAKGYQGGAIVTDATGYGSSGATATGLKCWGVASADYDNTGGANGAIAINARPGVFKFANSAAGDLLAQADVGNVVYLVDDQTVAKTSGTSTRSKAGFLYGVDPDGTCLVSVGHPACWL